MKLKDMNFTGTYGRVPESFSARVQQTLRDVQKEEKPMRRITAWTIAIALLLMLTGAAAAAVYSGTIAYFDFMYGVSYTDKLEDGDHASVGEEICIGGVAFTLEDVIWSGGNLYGSGVIRPLGDDIVLVPEDYAPDDPAGYLLHWPQARETVDENAPTYRDLMRAGKRVLCVRCIPDYVYDTSGEPSYHDVGYDGLIQQDGSIRFGFEIAAVGVDKWHAGEMGEDAIERAESYRVRMYASVTPMLDAPQGSDEYLDRNQRESLEWDVTVMPE